MKTIILCVGKIKEKYWADAIAEYTKRLSAYCKLEIIEIAEGKGETEAILSKLDDKSFKIALDINGKAISSEAFSSVYADIMNRGSNMVFIIGGSEGLDKAVKKRCDYIISFSNLTFPYQMMRVFLVEQIYRAWKIIRNEPYHK